MRKRFQVINILSVGLGLLTAQAQAQNGVISATATAGTGGATLICINADANVKGMAGLDLVIHFPAGVSLVGTGDAAFMHGTFTNGGLVAVSTNDPSQIHVAVVLTAGKNGPTDIGCVDLTTSANFRGGDVTLEVTANDENSNVIPVTILQSPLLSHEYCVGNCDRNCPCDPIGDPPFGDFPPPANAAGDVDITDITGAPGQTVLVTVTTAKTGVAGADLTILFDPNLFQFTGTDADFKVGSIFSGALIAVQTTNKAIGRLRVAVVTPNPNIQAGTLVTFPLVISATAAAPNYSSLNLDVTLNDVNSNILAATVGNAVVTIQQGAQATLGDANGDGRFDVSDIREAIRLLFNAPTDPTSRLKVDMNADGVVDLIDIRRLLKLLLDRA
jgi:hypothetical protein